MKHGRVILVRPLANGDVETVMAVFERLGERSRRTRFNGPKPRLSPAELEHLAAVDATRHVLVAYLEGDDRPAADRPRLVREGSSAEIAFEVADEHQRLGIGSALTTPSCSPTRGPRGSPRSPPSSRATTPRPSASYAGSSTASRSATRGPARYSRRLA